MYLDNVQQNEQPTSNLFLEGIMSTVYKVRVDWQNDALEDFTKNLPIGNQNGPEHHKYIIKQNRRGDWVFRYQGGNPIQSAPPANATPAQPVAAASATSEGGGFSINMNISDDGQSGSASVTIGGETISAGVNGGSTRGATTENTGCGYPMRLNDFMDAKRSLANESFDSRRLESSKQIATTNCLSADQIAQISTLFEFDNNRLEFAKAAFDKCTDKGNYFKLNETFEFSANARKLEEYISKR